MSGARRRLVDLVRPEVVVLAHGGDHDHDSAPRAPIAGGPPGRPPLAYPHSIVPAPLLRLDGRRGDASIVGAKAASLAWLAGHGARVPATVVVPGDVVSRIAASDTLTIELLAGALGRWLDPGATYAIRPSPSGGDEHLARLPGRSGARLDLPAAEVPAAVPELVVHAAAGGPESVAVVIQPMVRATATGIAFSRNPLSGLDEVVVEAVTSPGDALIPDGVTPERWVRRWGTFIESPAAPRTPQPVVESVAKDTARLARAYGRPIELEWAHDGSATWWLQLRAMAGLDGLRVYSNRIARDVLPGVIKPLVWSVNVPVVNAAWIDLLEELVGPLGVRPEDLARSFGYRAYFDMTTIGSVFEALGMPRDSLELLLGFPKGPEAPRFRPGRGTMRHGPRVLGAAGRMLRRGRWTRAEVRDLRRAWAVLAADDPAVLDEAALLQRVDAITPLARRAAYANIVVPLVMHGYERALALQLRAVGVDPADLDPSAERSDRTVWSPTAALDEIAELARRLPADARDALAAGRMTALAEREDLAEMRIALDVFLARFGDLAERSNDLSLPTWREDPGTVIDLVLAHRERRAAGGAAREASTLDAVLSRVPRIRRPLVRLLWRRAGAFRVYREAVGATWTAVYGLFRGTFLALGQRFVARGMLAGPDDIFYLSLDEIRAASAGGSSPSTSEIARLVARRRSEMADAADLLVPELVYGDAFVARHADETVGAAVAGIPASRGSVRGTARVVRAGAEFGRVVAGDVIIIPFSDVAWTPLFARAAAVVTETGGILSHAAIVAREYGIPCVVSVPDACTTIPDGATVIVDGTAGTVLVEVDPVV